MVQIVRCQWYRQWAASGTDSELPMVQTYKTMTNIPSTLSQISHCPLQSFPAGSSCSLHAATSTMHNDTVIHCFSFYISTDIFLLLIFGIHTCSTHLLSLLPNLLFDNQRKAETKKSLKEAQLNKYFLTHTCLFDKECKTKLLSLTRVRYMVLGNTWIFMR